MTDTPLAAIILAAGQGKRMHSDLPKVAHMCAGKPLVRWVIEAARAAGAEPVVAVVGHGADVVRALVPDAVCALQPAQRGTGDAVRCALPALEAAGFAGPVLVLNGDSPLVSADTLKRLADVQVQTGAAVVALTFMAENPFGYGRILRDAATGDVLRIVEQKDATPEEAAITECNAGFYCFDMAALSDALGRLTSDNAQGEYYLTDVLELSRAAGRRVVACVADDPAECLGVNTAEQLADVEVRMENRMKAAAEAAEAAVAQNAAQYAAHAEAQIEMAEERHAAQYAAHGEVQTQMAEEKNTVQYAAHAEVQAAEAADASEPTPIHFGTDGWRAIIGKDFTEENVVRVVVAAAQAFAEDARAAGYAFDGSTSAPVLYVGHDCRLFAHEYAELAASVAAAHGFQVKLTQDYCPTPTLCWSVARDACAVGGIMLTSSHNPAEYLGVKLRMADGGASPKEFTDRVEALLPAVPPEARGGWEEVDLMTPYLASLIQLVDAEAIRGAHLRVVVDPLYGAGRGYLAGLLRGLGVDVTEIHADADPTFAGLHPEPIPPWVNEGLAKTAELAADALFINDGDADRIGAGDRFGNFVNPHRIITLLTSHLVEDCGRAGRVVSTITASAMLDRMCRRLGLELVSTPVGFKWIYAEMANGGVLLGGEESGGIGIPEHVFERDGLLMALLLCEMMAQRGCDMAGLVDWLFATVGRLEFTRIGVRISEEQMARFRAETIPGYAPAEVCGKRVVGIDRRDGVKLLLEGDAWLMMRPSGTEPLVRIYAEAATTDEVDALLAAGEAVVKGE